MNTRRLRRHPDQGATLLIVLIIISVISLVMSVVIAQADTSVRATVQLRDQAADVYGADGATNAVLTALKNSALDCSDPSNLNGLPLGSTAAPFYSPVSSQQGAINAYAQCTPDSVAGTGVSMSTPPPVTSTATITPAPVTSTAPYLGSGDPTLPTYAVLTTGSSGTDFGLDLSPSAGANTVIYVENGSVGSKKNINASGLCLNVRLTKTTNTTGCGSGTGVDSTTNTRLVTQAEGMDGCIGGTAAFQPTSCDSPKSDGTGKNVSIVVPDAPDLPGKIVAENPTPTCLTSGKNGNQKTYAALAPGRYTDATLLNTPCNGAAADWEWLTPGNYYFDYGTTPWQWPTRLIAGTPLNGTQKITTLANLSNANASPGSCDDAGKHIDDGVTVSGVSMVFGGSSRIAAATSTGSAAEICASTPTPTNPPVAIYALTQDQTVAETAAAGGANKTIPAESIGTTSFIDTSFNNNNGHAQVYIKGYVYAPTVQMVLRLENSSGQVFNWGVIVKDLRLRLNGSSPTLPVFDLPKPNTGVGIRVIVSQPPTQTVTATSTPPAVPVTTYSIRYIKVWTCLVSALSATQPNCPTTGSANVVVRVYTDPNGKPVKILSWTRLR